MVTYTSSSLYWSPLKPRINIYAFSDSTYSSPIYTYNAFTDAGSTTKPIALNFDSQTTNVGTFSIEIEDTGYELEPDTFMKGNRIFIECSKNGSTWQPAFKGLVRSSDQQIYATSGRNFTISGYSYLIRLNERVINTIEESSLTGADYDRTDSTMFSDNLIQRLLTDDTVYIHSNDDEQLYDILKTDNITSSPITDWIPRLDAQLVTVNDAINSVLEFSNGLIMLNPADDELVLYNPDLVTSATSIFLLTNQMNQAADDADYTMYPLGPYRYNISYDYPDSGSRLIGSIGSGGGDQCPATVDNPPVDAWSINSTDIDNSQIVFAAAGVPVSTEIACIFKANTTLMHDFTMPLRVHAGNFSTTTSMNVSVRAYTGSTVTPGSQIGSTMTLYRDFVPGTPFPSTVTPIFIIGQEKGTTGPTLTFGEHYWIVIHNGGQSTSETKTLAIRFNPGGELQYVTRSRDNMSSWLAFGGSTIETLPRFFFSYSEGGNPACGGGGTQATIDADPVFAVAHDRNMSNRLGIVERVISGIPTHIKTAQTLNEYLYNKLYYAAKPRFTFDYPSVSMPNRIPKAGDIVAHVDSKARVGTIEGAVQTGVISSVGYTFDQGQDGVLGLRRLSLSTTGIRRGSY